MSFGAVGITSNAVTYGLYLLLTLGVGHKTAMTLVFAISVLLIYAFNRRWTFRHPGRVVQSARRYIAVYLFAYLGNLAALPG